MTNNRARDVKLVAAGDGAVGKTCLLMTYAHNKFSEGYVPTVFDTYDMEVLVEGQSIRRKFPLFKHNRNNYRYQNTSNKASSLSFRKIRVLILVGLWDTAGQEDYDRLRPLSYANADVFVACFNLTNKDSLTHIEEKWVPELRHYGRKVPIILVGCKQDLRTDNGNKEEVSTIEGSR